MQLVVGVLCEEGIVVGSADRGLQPAPDFYRCEPPLASTLVVGRDVILAGTGRIGLGQRFAEVVAAIRSDSRFLEWTGLRIAKTVCAEVIEDFASTRCTEAQFEALLAFAACDGLQLCRFAAGDLQPELKTPERWFAALGSGRVVAEPFLGLLRRAFFADAQPSLRQGLFAAVWTLDYTVGLDPAQKTGGTRIAVLAEEAAGLPPTARLLPHDQFSQCLAQVRAAEKHLATYRQRL